MSGATSVPAGTGMVIKLNEALSSQSAKVDQVFTFTVDRDAFSDGMLVIPKGAQGQGHVAAVSAARIGAKAGSLTLEFDWVVSADGAKLHVSGSNEAAGGVNATTFAGVYTAAAVAQSTIYSVFAPLAALGNWAYRGKKAGIGTDVRMAIFVSAPGHVQSDLRIEYHDGFAH